MIRFGASKGPWRPAGGLLGVGRPAIPDWDLEAAAVGASAVGNSETDVVSGDVAMVGLNVEEAFTVISLARA